nr:hypothetical protein [Enterococcus casseliflavus]
MAATGAPFYFTQKTARNERFLVISCGFLLWTYVTVPQTNLVDENCYLSKELKVQIALELAKNTTRKEIDDRYFASSMTVLRVLHRNKTNCIEKE